MLIVILKFGNVPIRTHVEATAWFSASDICTALHHSNPRVAIKAVSQNHVRRFPLKDTIGRHQSSPMLSRVGLEELLARSHKPQASHLHTWLLRDAMPTLEPLFGARVVETGQAAGHLSSSWHERIAIQHGDCIEILRTLPSDSVDSLIADPPAGIGLRGADWDGDRGGRDAWIGWLTDIMSEAYRVLKPGGHGYVWALPRRSHWTAMALEDAGFEVRDRFTHIFGNGAPKTHRLQEPWRAWATNLRPAVEDWWLVRKPMAHATSSANMDAYSVGGLHVEACRIPVDNPEMAGRYPTHLLLTHHIDCDEECVDGCPVKALDTQSGDRCGSALRHHHNLTNVTPQRSASRIPNDTPFTYGDTGGASRFYHQFQLSPEDDIPFLYVARAASSEKNAGCDTLPAGRNPHPSVKPVKLVLHLLRLVTPADGLVIDLFAGSGTAGVAAVQGGFRYLGMEQEAEYVSVAQARIAYTFGLQTS